MCNLHGCHQLTWPTMWLLIIILVNIAPKCLNVSDMAVTFSYDICMYPCLKVWQIGSYSFGEAPKMLNFCQIIHNLHAITIVLAITSKALCQLFELCNVTAICGYYVFFTNCLRNLSKDTVLHDIKIDLATSSGSIHQMECKNICREEFKEYALFIKQWYGS